MRKALLVLFLIIVHAISNAAEIKESIHKAFINQDTQLLKEAIKEQSVDCRLISAQHLSTEFFYDGDWHLYNWKGQHAYLLLDNQTVANSDDIVLDPFLVIRTKHTRKTPLVDVKASIQEFSKWDAINPAAYTGRLVSIEELPELKKEHKRYFQSQKTVLITNTSHEFADGNPSFSIDTDPSTCEELWWQVADKPFEDERSCSLIGNFEGVQPGSCAIHFDLLTSTFFNPEHMYFIRVKAKHEGNWTSWSEAFAFTVNKPESVFEPEFEAKEDGSAAINWHSDNPEGTRYHIFASNALDFIPSIYSDLQVNSVGGGEILDEEENFNLIAVTTEKSIQVSEEYAYYRIIAEHNGIYSVPSPIIRYYKDDLILPRTVLQTDKKGFGTRVSFPAPYSGNDSQPENPLEAIARKMFGGKRIYRPEGIPNEAWEKVTPYLMPDNHPVKEKLDRVFTKSRATFSVKTLQQAGFSNISCGQWSHTTVAKHHRLKGYIIKLFRDEQHGRVDWHQWVKRCYGSKKVREYIANNKLGSIMKAPRKWIYPLPKEPSPPEPCERKNFILVAQDMNILKSKDNKAVWASNTITKSILNSIFAIITDLGLSDTVQAFNMPFSTDGRICLIDLEHNFEWPIPYGVLSHYLNHSNASYWESLIHRHGNK